MYPARRPNYALRRTIAAAVVVVVLYVALKLVGAVFGGGGGGAEAAQSPSSSSTTSTSIPLVSPPVCQFAETRTEAVLLQEWQRSIVDTELRLPADYAPTDLVSASEAGFDERFQIRPMLVDDLAALRQAAEDNGTPIELIAAHRSVADQQDLFSRREAELGFDAAAEKTARPGHSEHHLGTTVDFKTEGADDVFQSWADEPAGQFVLANAHRFGFMVSYPNGQQASTCYDFEPWHYRYFGVDLATKIHDSGLTAREYLWHWQETGQEPASL